MADASPGSFSLETDVTLCVLRADLVRNIDSIPQVNQFLSLPAASPKVEPRSFSRKKVLPSSNYLVVFVKIESEG